MSPQNLANGIVRAVLILAGIVLFFWFLYAIRSVIAYLAIAAVIALLGKPIVNLLQRIRFPRTLAVLVSMGLLLGLFVGIISLFIPVINEQSKNLSLLDYNALRDDLTQLYLQIVEYFDANLPTLEGILANSDIEKSILEGLDLRFIPNFLNSFLSALSNFSVGLFSVLFISFFFLKDSNLLQNGILTFVPDKKEGNMVESIRKINNLLSRYFGGILLQLFILFVIYTGALLIVGVENALVIAFLCSLFNIIPYIGPLIGGSIMLILTMTSFLGADFSTVILPKATYVLIGLIIGQGVDNFFSEPFIFSNSVKTHPLEIFLVIIIAGLLFGVIGMIVAVPGYTAIKVILKEFLADNEVVKKFTRNV